MSNNISNDSAWQTESNDVSYKGWGVRKKILSIEAKQKNYKFFNMGSYAEFVFEGGVTS